MVKWINLFLVTLCIGTLLHLFSSPVHAYTETTYYIHQDHLGSVVAVSDEQGNNVSQTKYSPYGKEALSVKREAESITERGYTGQIADKNTSLAYYNARYYDPVLSRFISADSVNDQQNRYSYVGGNPVMRNDPGGNMFDQGGVGGGRGDNNTDLTDDYYGRQYSTKVRDLDFYYENKAQHTEEFIKLFDDMVRRKMKSESLAMTKDEISSFLGFSNNVKIIHPWQKISIKPGELESTKWKAFEATIDRYIEASYPELSKLEGNSFIRRYLTLATEAVSTYRYPTGSPIDWMISGTLTEKMSSPECFQKSVFLHVFLGKKGIVSEVTTLGLFSGLQAHAIVRSGSYYLDPNNKLFGTEVQYREAITETKRKSIELIGLNPNFLIVGETSLFNPIKETASIDTMQ